MLLIKEENNVFNSGSRKSRKEYDNTRHNIGFETIDYISNKYNIEINRKKFKGVCGEGFINNTKVILLKPSTYMNLSGESVAEAVKFYKLEKEEVIIIYDDISLEVGRLRIREKEVWWT